MNSAPDDSILPLTRIISASVILILICAFVSLYILPDHTDIDFAWTILPPTSAMLIGAGYTAGAYFFARLISDGKWHRVQAGFLPITAFTIVMLLATILHWGRFHQGTFIFYVWTIVYILTPLIVPFIWWRNKVTESHELETHDFRFPSIIQWILGGIGLLGVLGSVIVFIQPSIVISLAPWKLTELTARIFSGWFLLSCLTVLSIARDGRWSAARILMESVIVGLGLVTLAMPRMWSDLNLSNPFAYVFAGGIILTVLVFIVLHLWLDSSVHQQG